MSKFRIYNSGDTLPNGATVIGAREKVIHDEGIIVARWGDEYVTWAYCPSNGNTFWGHYFNSCEEAMKDYYSRCYVMN